VYQSERLDTLVRFPIERNLKFAKIFAKAISAATIASSERYEIKAVVQHKNSN
jgi:hypothetical protein